MRNENSRSIFWTNDRYPQAWQGISKCRRAITPKKEKSGLYYAMLITTNIIRQH